MSEFIYNKIFDVIHANDPTLINDPLVEKTKLIEKRFTSLVDYLKNPQDLPLKPINELMSLFWDLVGNTICPSAIANIPSLSFFAEIKKDKSVAFILTPENWLDLLKTDTFYQMGGLVYVASKAKDYWNNKITKLSENEMHARAISHEAELLHYFKQNEKSFNPNAYQQDIMTKYPNGIASEPLNYVSRPFSAGGPPYPMPKPSELN